MVFNWICLNRKDFRKFKLTRMRNLVVSQSFIKREIDEDMIEFIFKDNLKRNSIYITIKFRHQFKDHITEHFQKSVIDETSEGIFVKEYFPNDEGLIQYILSFGNRCEVIEPLALRIQINEYLLKMIEAYTD